MKEYIFLVYIVIALVFASGCTNPLAGQNVKDIVQQAIPTDSPANNTPTSSIPMQTYTSNEISFNYPTSWEMITPDKVLTIHDNPNLYDLIAISPKGDDPTLVSFQRTVSSAQLASEVNSKKQDIKNNNNGQILSEKTFTLDNVPATALTYEYPDHQYRFLAVFLEKNNIVYAIIMGARKNEFANHAASLEMILNSFHIK